MRRRRRPGPGKCVCCGRRGPRIHPELSRNAWSRTFSVRFAGGCLMHIGQFWLDSGKRLPSPFAAAPRVPAFFAFALRANGRAGNSILGSCRNLPCAHLARISPWGPFPLQKKHANKGASPSGGPLIARQASACLTWQRRLLPGPVPALCPDLRADPTGADPAGRPPSGRRCARSPGPRPWPGRRPRSSPG